MYRRIRLMLTLLLAMSALLTSALFAQADASEAKDMEVEMEEAGILENAPGFGLPLDGDIALNIDLEDGLLSDALIDLAPLQDVDAQELEIVGEVIVQTEDASDVGYDTHDQNEEVSVEIDGASVEAIEAMPEAVADETALASQPDDSATPDGAAVNAVESLANVTTSGSADNDTLFEGYLNRVLPGMGSVHSNRSAYSGRRSLSGLNLRLYDALVPMIREVAGGERTSTELSVNDDDAGLTNNWWTAEELGLSSLDDANLGMKLLAKEGFNQRKIMQALLADYPYELYWFNKTTGGGMGWSYTKFFITKDDVKYARLGKLTAKMSVSADYSKTGTVGTYEVNDLPARVHTAVTNIKAIVSDNTSKDDITKLTAYAQKICELVDYNWDYEGLSYGDPWQLVFIFDGDENTKVVCEGYSKGFKYLCDLSDFEGDVACELMSGGIPEAHMWNAVRMPDGRTYLVDLTNSDNGSVWEGRLFMKGCAGEPGGPYTCGGLQYTYGDNMLSTYGIEWLTLSGADYGKGYAVKASAEQGALISNPSVADAGATVTLTVNPDAGYKAVAPVVRFGDGFLDLQRTGEREWRFTMPCGDVTATVACETAFAVEGFSGTYDGRQHGIRISSEDAALIVAYGTSKGVYDLVESPTWADVGTHPVYYYIHTGNSKVIEGEATVAIAPKTVGLSWSDTAFTYDGNSHAPTATATGLASGDICTVAVDGEQTDVGNYTAEATSLSNGNYVLPQNALQTFTIAQRKATLVWTNASFVYNGALQAPAATVDNLVKGDACAVTVTGAQKDVGSYKAAAIALSNGNYVLPQNELQTFTIAPRKATLVWTNASFIYNGALQAPAATVGNLIEGDACAVTVTGAQKDVGSYKAAAIALSNGNYVLPQNALQTFTIAPRKATLVWTNASFIYNGALQAPSATIGNLIEGDACAVTVTGAQKDAGSYKAEAIALSNGNYALPDDANQAFDIAPRPVSLEWESANVTYNGKIQKPRATAVGLISGDVCSVTVRGAKKKAGSYTVRASGLSNSNYALPDDATHAFVIAPKTVGLKWKKTTLTYNGNVQKPVATVTGVINGDKCTATVTGAKKNAGSYTARASKLSNRNYALPKNRTRTFRIKQKTVGLKWTGTRLKYTGQKIAPTARATGLIKGDKCTVTVTGAMKKRGTYTAKATKLSNSNYMLPAKRTIEFEIY